MERKPTYDELLALIDRLQATIEQQQATIERLQKRVDELERGGKRQAAPFSKGPPKSNPNPPGRKSGDAHGKHYFREKPARIDEVLDAPLPPQCPHCGGCEWNCIEISTQFQTEIPRRVMHRQFNIQQAVCKACGKRSRGRHPLQTSDATGAAGVQWGANAQVLAVTLNKECGLSHGKIARVFESAFNAPMARATSARAMLRAAKRLQPARGAIAEEIKSSPAAVPDETGWKIDGILHWLHVFATPRAILYLIRPGRGFDVAAEALGANYSGLLTCDGWAPYEQFEKATHQTCLAHILRRCSNLAEILPPGAAQFSKRIKALIQAGLEWRDRRENGEISPAEAHENGRALERNMTLLAWNKKQNRDNERFARFIRRKCGAFFSFLRHPGQDPTNGDAERAIRPMVVNRKVWGGNRTRRGAWAQEILGTVLFTAALRNLRGFDFIVQALHAPPHLPQFLPSGSA